MNANKKLTTDIAKCFVFCYEWVDFSIYVKNDSFLVIDDNLDNLNSIWLFEQCLNATFTIMWCSLWAFLHTTAFSLKLPSSFACSFLRVCGTYQFPIEQFVLITLTVVHCSRFAACVFSSYLWFLDLPWTGQYKCEE